MIINYNKFNISESIYTEKDINQILDKGVEHFDESDYAVLNSYATDDVELKELIKKIKGYKEVFQTLNTLIKNEKDEVKKKMFFKKWLQNHEELSELEKQLMIKFKIEDLNKIKKLEESLEFNPKYKYSSLTIGPIDSQENFQLVGDFMKNFCLKYVIENDISDFFENFTSRIFTEPIYLRVDTSDYRNRLGVKWGNMARLKDNDMTGGHTYERMISIKDLQNGALDNIMKYNTAFPAPSYIPRKMDRMLESNETISDVYKKKLTYCKYNPLVVRIVDQEDKDYFFNLVGWYGVFPDYELSDYPIGTDYILTLKDNTMGIDAFRIAYADDYTYYDSGDFTSRNPNIYPKLLTPGDLYYVLKELLGIPDAKSMYSPKKIVHSTDVLDESVTHWPYRFKTEEEFIKQYGDNWKTNILQENPSPIDVGVSWSRDMGYLLGQDCEIEDLDMSVNQRYHLPTDKTYRGYWIVTNEMIIKKKSLEPSYQPRKVDRTLESLHSDITIETIKRPFLIKSWQENWDIVETNLLRNKIKWIRNDYNVSLLGTLANTIEKYPYLYFEISEQGTLTWADPSEYSDVSVNKPLMILDSEDKIKKFFTTAPSYEPRKFDRTLESKENLKYEHIIIKIESLSEFRKAQRELLNQNYTWITDSTRVQDSTRGEEYPLYIFVNGETVRYHRRRFFYECENLLDEGNLQRTIVRRQEGSDKDQICPKIYTIHDMNNVDRLFNIIVEPNYRPRKMDRTFEGFTNKQDEEVNVLIQSHEHNEKLQRELFTLGYSWYENDRSVRDMKIGNVITFYPEDKCIVWSNDVEEHNKFIKSGWRKSSKIYPSIQVCEPNYKPKKIERTLESYKGYTYDSIVVQINNVEEAELVRKYISKYESGNNAINAVLEKFERFDEPVYIRINFGNQNNEVYWKITHGTVNYLLNGTDSSDPSYEKIFTIRDLESGLLDNIIKFSKAIANPSYIPRKITRTLEDKTWYPYRFKTEDEMIEAFGDGWREYAFEGTGWSEVDEDNGWSEMDKYLGQDFPYTKEELTDRNFTEDAIRGRYNGWAIHWDMLTPNKPIEKPNYTPRKIDRTLESITKETKYNFIIFKFETEEEFEEGQKILNKEGFTWTDSNYTIIENDKDFPCYLFVQGKKGDSWDNHIYYDTQNDLNNGSVYDTIIHRNHGSKMEEICPKVFTLNDTPNANKLFDYGIVPSYTPRKVDRTLESLDSDNFTFNTIVFEVLNEEQNRRAQTSLFELGYHWSSMSKKVMEYQRYPVYLFVSLDMSLSYMSDLNRRTYPHRNITEYIDYTIEVYQDNVCKTIFKYDDVKYIKQLFKTGRSTPSYTPRKVDRTLEATDFEKNVIKKIQSVLTKDLLVPEWAKKLETGKHHPFAGHCYAASEALYHLLGGKEKGYKPMRGKGLNNETHWWIVDKNGNILDPTSEQFYFVGLKPPYENGKGSGFLTKQPSKRAKEIISRIQTL